MGTVTHISRARGASREPWLNKRQIAEHLGVTPRTIERWHALGLPYSKAAGLCRYRASSVDGWVIARTDT